MPGKSRELRIGIIGLRLGQWHIETIAGLEGAKVTAIADNIAGPLIGTDLTVEDYARKLGAKAYDDGVKLIQNEDVDAVSLCVSPKWRKPLLIAAAKRKLPVLVEKPWATNLAHGLELAAIVKDAGLTAMVEHPLRYFQPIIDLRDLLAGPLGKPLLVSADLAMSRVLVANNWMWDPNNGNGPINENSCHIFDTLCYLLGDPESLQASGRSFYGIGAPIEDAAAMTIKFRGSAIASVTAGAVGALAIGTKTWLDVYAENGQAIVTGNYHMYDTLTWARFDDAEAKIQSWELPPRRQIMRYSMQHFLECVREGKTPSCGVDDGVRALALSMAVKESIAKGTPVEVAGY
jgi:predicted dehydrogenase